MPSKFGRWVISDTGTGTPPIDYVVQRSPFQDGATVKGFFLQPRTVTLLIRHGFCSRDAYWTGRAGILDALRPNRQLVPTGVLPGILEKTLPSGEQRRLDVYIAVGPAFEPSKPGSWSEWDFREVLNFTAYNPVWYDAAQSNLVAFAGSELVFPITFPIIFEALLSETTIHYLGTWLEYPTIMITGPISAPVIDNLTTGERIGLDYNIPAGVTVSIVLTPGYKTVTDNLGNNLIGAVTTDSDLATFHLAPDPEAPGGMNDIRIGGGGTTAGTSLRISWYARYFGI